MRNNDGNQVAPLMREHPRCRYTPVDTPCFAAFSSTSLQAILSLLLQPLLLTCFFLTVADRQVNLAAVAAMATLSDVCPHHELDDLT